MAWGAADDAAAAKKISDEAAAAKKAADERQKQVEEDLRRMSAMVQELARDLGAERAARIQLQKIVQT